MLALILSPTVPENQANVLVYMISDTSFSLSIALTLFIILSFKERGRKLKEGAKPPLFETTSPAKHEST